MSAWSRPSPSSRTPSATRKPRCSRRSASITPQRCRNTLSAASTAAGDDKGERHQARLSPGAGRQPASPTPRRSPRVKLFIDNWRWEGVPIYLRSGKALWKRGTEIVVQFKKAPVVLFRGTAVAKAGGQPADLPHPARPGIEIAVPGQDPRPDDAACRPVNMRFNYGEAFKAARGHRLRSHDLQLHERRCDAVLADRPGGNGLADRAAAARRLGRDAGDGFPQLPARIAGDRRRRPT